MPAAGSSRTPLIIAIVVIALGGLAVLNTFQERNDPGYQEKMEREKAREAAQKAAEQQKNNPQKPPSADGPEQQLVSFGADKLLGNPQGTETVTVGWRWTPEVQSDPSKVYAGVNALQQAAGGAKIRVVNLDAQPGAVPEGVSIGSKVVLQLMPDGSLPPPQAVSQAVVSMLKSGAPGAAGGGAAVAPGAPGAPNPAPPGPAVMPKP